MTPFDKAFERVIGIEGGFVDDPSDSGGATKYGITERVARANGYRGNMRDLDLPTAKLIMKHQYWDVLRLDDVANVNPVMGDMIAEEMFDTAINMGVSKSARFLQTALNVFNRGQKDYHDIQVDGVMGPVTLDALERFSDARSGNEDLQVLLKALNCLQGAAYIDLAERREKDERFVYGWIDDRIQL